jgi:hypothetical protein
MRLGRGLLARIPLLVLLGSIDACRAPVASLGSWSPDAGTGFYIEAESGELAGGFTVVTDSSAFGGEAIEPPAGASSPPTAPGSARALYVFSLSAPGSYVIWGRIHSPDTAHNTSWVQVDGATWHLWRITTGEIWYWDKIHDDDNYNTPLVFDLTAGTHQLSIANAVDQVGLDSFYITKGTDRPPPDETACSPPDSIQVSGTCVPSCGSLGGNTCGADVCAGQTALPVYDCAVCCIVPGLSP